MSATIELPERSVARDKDPLKHRRVRHRESGRVGTLESAARSYHLLSGKPSGAQAFVRFDDGECYPGSNYIRGERLPLDELELLDPPPITAPVRVRKVLFRGRKEQVAERWAALGPLTEEQIAQGCERYVEFDPQPMAYRRWRIVHVGPPLEQQRVDETPDQYPRAENLRRLAREAGAYEEPDGYGY